MSDENIIYVLIAYIFCGFALIYLFLQSLKFLRDSKKKINKIYSKND
jgi:TM2 domain-containing membrane protein YozV